jgi:tyrosine ammonia-lyase
MNSSKRFRKKKEFYFDDEKIQEEEIFQDAYSVRTIPQVLGGVKDFLDFSETTIENELNSVSDNPIISTEITHGGNFQGTSVSIAADLISICILNLASLLERMIARITDKNLNQGLPPFLQKKQNGLHSGFMGVQVTATSILAYMRSISNPSSIQSISTNANNQDIVSMGTIAANKTKELLEKYFYLISILGILVSQAKEIIEENENTKFSDESEKYYKLIRKMVPSLEGDRSFSDEIMKLSFYFKNH